MTEFNGYISSLRVFKYLGGKENDVISDRKLRAMVNELTNLGLEKGIEYQGQHYRLKKVSGRGNYTIIPSQQPTRQETDTDLDEETMPQRQDAELEAV